MSLGEKPVEVKENKSQFICNKGIELLNYRINEEEFTSRLYKSMAIWFKSKSYNGFAKFWKDWADEELVHASWACHYLLDLDIKPDVRPLKEVKNVYESVEDVIRTTLEAEIEVTNQCKELASFAKEKEDFMLLNLAMKYLKEQQEEINKITNILAKVNSFGKSEIVLLELDEQFLENE